MTATALPQPAPDTASVDIDALDEELHELDKLIPLMDRMLEPAQGQRPMLRPEPTAAEKYRRNTLAHKEKLDLLENQRIGVSPGGMSPAPVSMAATEAIITVSGLITEIEQALWKHLAACPWPPMRRDRVRLYLIRKNLKHITSERVIHRIAQASAAALRTAELLVDGEPLQRLNARCPYCDRESLVIYKIDPRLKKGERDSPSEVIRCDKPRGSRCCCPTDDCPCKDPRHGWRHRHVWARDGGGWETLARLLNQHVESTRTIYSPIDDIDEEDEA